MTHTYLLFIFLAVFCTLWLSIRRNSMFSSHFVYQFFSFQLFHSHHFTTFFEVHGIDKILFTSISSPAGSSIHPFPASSGKFWLFINSYLFIPSLLTFPFIYWHWLLENTQWKLTDPNNSDQCQDLKSKNLTHNEQGRSCDSLNFPLTPIIKPSITAFLPYLHTTSARDSDCSPSRTLFHTHFYNKYLYSWQGQ